MNLVKSYRPRKKVKDIKPGDIVTILGYRSNDISVTELRLTPIRSKQRVLRIEKCCCKCDCSHKGIAITTIKGIGLCQIDIADEFGREFITNKS